MNQKTAKRIKRFVDFKSPEKSSAKTKRRAYRHLKSLHGKPVQTVKQKISKRQMRLKNKQVPNWVE